MKSRSGIATVLLVWSLAAGSGAAFAREYYVDGKSGSDANAGTLSAPFRTIGKAMALVAAGDVVLVREGTYNEEVLVVRGGTAGNPVTLRNYPGERVIIDCSMDVTQWTQIPGTNVWQASFTHRQRIAYGGISEEVAPVSTAPDGYGYSGTRRAFLYVDDVPDESHWLRAVNITGTSPEYSPATIPAGAFATDVPPPPLPSGESYAGRTNTIYAHLADNSNPNNHRMRIAAYKHGIHFPDWGRSVSYVRIIGLQTRLNEVGVTIDTDGPDVSSYIHLDSMDVSLTEERGIEAGWGARNITITNSHIHHMMEEGIHLQADHSRISNNVIDSTVAPWHRYGCMGINVLGNDDTLSLNEIHHIRTNYLGFAGNGIYMEEWYNGAAGESYAEGTQRIVIERNRIHDNEYRGITVAGSDSALIANNLLYDNAAGGIKIEGGGSDGGPSASQQSAVGNRVYFNTIVGSGGSGIDLASGVQGTAVRNNIVFNNARTIVNSGGGSFIDRNLTTDPAFVDAGRRDFHLRTGSAAIDAGVDVGVRYDFDGVGRAQGSGFDIGAFEYVPVGGLPATPQLGSPADGATGQPATLTLSWSPSLGASGYRLQVSMSSSFVSTVLDDSTITGTSRAVGPLSESTTYYWRVMAKNSLGSSPYSTARSFVTSVWKAPEGTTPLSPGNGSTGQPTTVTLSWSPSSGATHYRLQVSPTNSFVSTVIDDSTITANSRMIGPLFESATYYWRVMAKNSAGSSPYSVVWRFDTRALSTPAIVNPPEGAQDQSTQPILRWSGVAGSTIYHLQLARDPVFTSMVFEDSTIADSVKEVGPLAEATVYFARVRAGNGVGWGAYSSPVSFATGVSSMQAPAPIAPSNGSSREPIQLTFKWSSVPGAIRYHLQLATDAVFQSVVFQDSLIPGATRDVGPLKNKTKYYWRIRAIGDAASSFFSSSQNFKTIVAQPKPPKIGPPSRPPSGMGILISWTASEDAESYVLQLSLDSVFAHPVIDSTVVDTMLVVTGLAGNTGYFGRAQAQNIAGTSGYSTTLQFYTNSEGTAAFPGTLPPLDYTLAQNYPNPFNPSTTIEYEVPAPGPVTLEVFDLLGRVVATLVSANVSSGRHSAVWDAQGFPSGVYFYRLQTQGFSETRRLIILK